MNNHKKMCRDLYLYYSENGICVKCGAAFSLAGHVLCGDCFKKSQLAQKRHDPTGEKKRERMRVIREDRRSKGLCVACGSKTDGIHQRCPKCLERVRERELLRRIKKRNGLK